MLVGALFKKFGLFLNTPRITHSVCSLGHPARNAHALYCIVACGLSVSTIVFPHDLINGTILRKKKVIEHEIYVLLSVQPSREASFILTVIQPDVTANVQSHPFKAARDLVWFFFFFTKLE